MNKTFTARDKMSTSLSENMNYLNKYLSVDTNFDVVYRVIKIGGREACMYFIDGFCKDEMMQKMLQYFLDIKEEEMPPTAHEMSKSNLPYVEVDLHDEWKQITYFIMSGVFALFIDGYDKCLLIDARTYPSRGVEEPEKDKVLRGSKDGFVETIVFNTALIRRRIRSEQLCMEMLHAGNSSQTDIVLCYMDIL
ncbi:MAG: spore germination protein [Lachnospiraceae bacterium]|nr:spore germination protein [Lachnospiraceae bacterium]